MTCYTETVDGVTAFICGNLGPPCVSCGAVAEGLCDFPLHDETGARTCDRPLCLRCAPEVGADKNYCAEHRELGPGLLLFPMQPRTADRPNSVAEAMARRPRARRLPKAPPEDRRWRVLSAEGIVLTSWTDEIGARQHARERSGRVVETWDDFVAWHRKTYPLAQRRRSRRPSET